MLTVILGLTSSLSYALSDMVSQHVSRGIGVVRVVFWVLATGVVLVVPVLFIVEGAGWHGEGWRGVGFAALAGVLLTARTGSGQPTSGSQGLELQSITAAALGGCSMQGGKGTIVGTIFAVVLLGVLQNGLIILDVNSFWQDIAQGALLVIAVVIQQRRAGGRGIGLPM